MEVKEKLEAILVRYGISMNSKDDEAEIDSFGFISMIVEIENEFNITIPDDFLSISLFDAKRLYNYIASVIAVEG